MQLTTPFSRRRAGRVIAASLVGAAALGSLAACSSGPSAPEGINEGTAKESPFDLTSASVDGRVRIDPVPEAVEALEQSGFEPIQEGKLTVATNAYEPPLAILAEDDTKTLIGSEPDIAQLVADGLGLEYAPESVSWADWPLGVESGKYDAAISNVTVTEERKDLFDFAVYRNDELGFSVAADSEIDSISEPADVAGLKVVVMSGTNQEKVLLDWFAQNEEAGLEPGEPIYFDDNAAGYLALTSGRVDAMLAPNPTSAFREATNGDTKVVGTISGGFPETAQIGVATAKGNGLVEPVQIVLNHAIETGALDELLDRWAVADEAVEESLINPPGLPRE